MNIRYRVELSETERSELQAMLSGGRQAARTLKRAQILLAADAGVPDEVIATGIAVGGSTAHQAPLRGRQSRQGAQRATPPRREA